MAECTRCHKKAWFPKAWGNYPNNLTKKTINYCPECNTLLLELVAKTAAAMKAADENTKARNLDYLDRIKEMERLLQPNENEVNIAVQQGGFDITLIRFLLIPYIQAYNTRFLGI